MTTNGPVRFPFIPRDGWREKAACARSADLTLWDGQRDVGESERARESRQAQAKTTCRAQCPVREACAADVDWRFDEGVRGGHVLPPLNTSSRGNASRRDAELARLLRAGVPLDEAAKVADRLPRRPTSKRVPGAGAA